MHTDGNLLKNIYRLLKYCDLHENKRVTIRFTDFYTSFKIFCEIYNSTRVFDFKIRFKFLSGTCNNN